MTDLEPLLTTVYRRVLRDPNLVLSRSLNATMVPTWDSLTHTELIAAVEEAFGVRFKLKEVTRWENTGDLMDCLREKLNAGA